MKPSDIETTKWNHIYVIGGAAALGAVLIGLLEIGITFLPGGNISQETVLDWFTLFQENPFMGLRDLGLLNLMLNFLGIFTFYALYAAHRRNRYLPYAVLALIIAVIGIAVFFATNRAFPMLDLSQQFAAASSEEVREHLISSGKAMLTVGASHTPGTFLGFMFIELAAILISMVMLVSGIFSKATGIVGVLGFGALLVFEYVSSFIAGLTEVTMGFAIVSGILSMVWYLLVAMQLFKLARVPEATQLD